MGLFFYLILCIFISFQEYVQYNLLTIILCLINSFVMLVFIIYK